MGLGEDGSDGKKLKSCIDDMGLIAGQKPVITKFKKSISNFKTRKGSNAGLKVTLRSHKMYEFIDRMINIALPRIKDFRGMTEKGIDSSNNYSFGIKEHIIFPEVNFDKVDKIRGLDIMIVTTSKSRAATIELLKEFNGPFAYIGHLFYTTVGVALIFPWGATFSAGHSRAPTLSTGTQMAAIERSHYELEPSTPTLSIRRLPK